MEMRKVDMKEYHLHMRRFPRRTEKCYADGDKWVVETIDSDSQKVVCTEIQYRKKPNEFFIS